MYESNELPAVVPPADSKCVFDVKDVDWQPGTNIQSPSAGRGELANLFNSDYRNFLSLGLKGKVTINAPTSGVSPDSNCPITDKILAFDEITWCNPSDQRYEVGRVGVKLERCHYPIHTEKKAISQTGAQVRLELPSPMYDGCFLKSITIEDYNQFATGVSVDGVDISNVTVLPMTH